ncbi:MAG: FAD-binding protein [Gemmatimonadaceae bacterium]
MRRLLKDGDRVAGALGYDRERGRFKIFHASAIVATGGVGRAFRITSNSWEYTGWTRAGVSRRRRSPGHGVRAVSPDGHGVATECARHPGHRRGTRRGGVLRNSNGERFMFNDIPENYRAQTADNEEEGGAIRRATRRRVAPELLTRDHVARCIMREVRDGRGSPHGGVFLDIAWIKARLPNAAEHIRKKLPSMYHQFKQLADIDITTTPMEVGPTTHYIMGGVRVDGDTQMSSVPGLFAAGECAAGLHGANRLGGNSLSDLLVFGKRAGEHAAKFARSVGAATIPESDLDAAAGRALAPFERESGPSPYQIQHELQDLMQDLVGIVRREEEMQSALQRIGALRERAAHVSVAGNREYNPGWHTALDLDNLLTVSEAITRSAIDRRESRGGHFRDDFPNKDPEAQRYNIVVRRGADGGMQLQRIAIPDLPAHLQQVIADEK